MQDLSNLIAYQKTALQVKKIESKFMKSQVRQKLVRARKYLVDSQELMKKHDAEIADLINRIEGVKIKLAESVSVLDEIDIAIKNVEEDDSLKEIKMLEKNAKEQEVNIKICEKEINKHIARLQNINDDLDKMAANVPRMKKEYTQLKKVYDEELAVVNEETLPLKKELKTLEKEIDEKLVKKYNQVAKSHPVVLVEMKGRMCTGCNMELPATFAKMLAESDAPVECENCGRLLYIKQK